MHAQYAQRSHFWFNHSQLLAMGLPKRRKLEPIDPTDPDAPLGRLRSVGNIGTVLARGGLTGQVDLDSLLLPMSAAEHVAAACKDMGKFATANNSAQQ